jgi:uncharacterized protein (TIGR03067 family)
MRRVLSVAAVLVLGGVAFAQGGPEGTYTIKAASVGGKELPAEVLATMSEVRLTATEFVVVQTSGKEDKTAIKLDAKATAIDMLPADKTGKTRLGLYKLDKDELTLAIGPADGKRPADFKGGDGVKVMVLMKKK